MRGWLCLLLALIPQHQAVDWARVDVNIRKLNPALSPVTLPQAQMQTLRKRLVDSIGKDAWPGCGASEDKLQVMHTPLAPRIFEVVPGSGNCRGGQGSNAALWLVRRQGSHWQILASPQDGFGGWGLGVQPHRSNGLPDLVLGWHMSAADFGLSYFRFNGTTYRRIASTEVRTCSSQTERFCLADGQPALDTSPPQ